MSAQIDHYKTLGLASSASAEEVKKAYRTLARRYHPDVNRKPEAERIFKTVNEAYHVLGDPDRRATYDAERLLSQPRTAPQPPTKPRPQSAPEPTVSFDARPRADAPRAEAPRPTEAFQFDGFGRTPPTPRPRAPHPAAPRTSPPPPPTTNASRPGTARPRPSDAFGTLDRLTADARLAFVNRKYQDVINLCQQALLIDRRNSLFHEMMGDAHAKLGQRDRAATAYTFAVQFNPNNISVQVKLDRLMGGGAPRPTPTMTRPVSQPVWDRLASNDSRDSVMIVFSVFLGFGFVLMTVLFALHNGLPLGVPIPGFADLSLNFIFALGFNGVVAGALLAFWGGMRPFTEEILTPGTLQGNRRTPISPNLLVVCVAFVWFYASLLVYFIVAVVRNRISPSILRAYGLTLLLIVLFSALYRPSSVPSAPVSAALLAGNFLFPALILGWAIGDVLRFRGR